MSAQYPTTPVPAYPVEVITIWNNLTSQFDSGKEQTRQKNLYAKYDVNLTYKVLSETNMQILWNFYQARRGNYDAFYFYTLQESDWNGVWIAMGDASTTAFDIPGKSTSSQIIYFNGAAVSSSLYTISYGDGDLVSDRVTFTSAPATNTQITCDFNGYMRIRCRFKDGNLTRNNFTTTLCTTGIALKGVAAI